MKNILRKSIFLSLLLAMVACEDSDKDPVTTANGFALNTPDTGTDYTLTPQNANNDLLTLTWGKSNNGPASVSAYSIEIAESGTNFANPIVANDIANPIVGQTYTWKVGYFNTLLNQIGFGPCESLNVDVRVKSTLGLVPNKAFIQYSSILTLNVTPYATELPLMAFSSSATITDATPIMAASSLLTSDYEGYMWLSVGSYKFYKANSCNLFDNPVVFGDDGLGSFNTLQVDGAGYDVLVAGYYLVKADLSAMTYSVRPTTWNLFGAAKPFFAQANSVMTYDQAAQVWKITITLSEGYEFKFRSNANTFVLGAFKPASINTPEYGGPVLTYNGLDLKVPGSRVVPRVNKSFTVTLDLKQPRNYNYTITENL
jgi:hypothetical protein